MPSAMPLVGYSAGKKVKFEHDAYEEFVQYIKHEGVNLVDACFVDPLGLWHHITFTTNQCTVKSLKAGWGFDGSSIRMMKTVTESDMLLIPDITTCFIDPFMKHKVLHVTCDVHNYDGTKSDRCCRTILKDTMKYIQKMDVCSDVVVGPEVEFFLFDNVIYKNAPNESRFVVECKDGYWNSSKPNCITETDAGCPGINNAKKNKIDATNHGQYMLKKQSYVPTIPIDQSNNMRADMLLTMQSIGMVTEKHHHEVACGQQELGIEYAPLLHSADNIMAYKYVVKNCAALSGKSATFMPKPMDGDNGSGMHTHVSLWQGKKNLFYDKNSDYHNLSELALKFIGGILNHAPALLAICNPTVNSYKRLTPGFEAPCVLTFSAGNRTAAIRIPMVDTENASGTRIEFRCPDPSCNPYLALSAIVLAGLDGIQSNITLPKPMEGDSNAQNVKALPGDLWQAMDALEADMEFLTKSGAFTSKFLRTYIEYKRKEYRDITNVPTPMEYQYYYAM